VLEARGAFIQFNGLLPRIHLLRGDVEAAREALTVFPEAGTSDDVQEKAAHALGQALLLRAEGNPREALDAATRALETREMLNIASETIKEAFLEAVEAAFDLQDLGRVEDVMAIVENEPPGKRPQYLQAHIHRFRARVALTRGEGEVERGFKAAAGSFRELGMPFWLAATLLEHGEWLVAQDRRDDASPPLTEAREIFERLGARPWLDRVEALVPAAAVGPQR
jgi:tetratricopeptide (TPR) repeat protein